MSLSKGSLRIKAPTLYTVIFLLPIAIALVAFVAWHLPFFYQIGFLKRFFVLGLCFSICMGIGLLAFRLISEIDFPYEISNGILWLKVFGISIPVDSISLQCEYVTRPGLLGQPIHGLEMKYKFLPPLFLVCEHPKRLNEALNCRVK